MQLLELEWLELEIEELRDGSNDLHHYHHPMMGRN